MSLKQLKALMPEAISFFPHLPEERCLFATQENLAGFLHGVALSYFATD